MDPEKPYIPPTTATSRRKPAIGLVRGRGKPTTKPWVLFVSFIAPHFPLIAPQEYFDLYALEDIAPIKPADPELMDNHPWWQAFNNCNTFDRYFRDDEHRKVAIASYMGLCTHVDALIGNVLSGLKDNGFAETTNICLYERPRRLHGSSRALG